MNTSMLIVGLAKMAFGILVGAGGILLAARGLHRWMGTAATDGEQQQGNVAVGVLKAGSLIALGVLLRHAVVATFDAMDLLYRDAAVSLSALGSLAIYSVLYVGLSMVVSATVLALGTWLFMRLTKGVDEMAEIRKGNVAPAVVMAAVMVVLALMTAP
ncbi:MAG TPA: DUF350 domain-containing protein, partial [Sorangium sp.]|nr:DUF350 domain-containing protein [Sorangium sp.]